MSDGADRFSGLDTASRIPGTREKSACGLEGPSLVGNREHEADVVVVGGGASGLMAAGQAAAFGIRTLVVEKMPRPARKLGITGKGRCNLTNRSGVPEFVEAFGDAGPFLRQAFHRFFVPDLVSFFEELGLATVTERGRRVFPASGRARDVVDALHGWVLGQGARVLTGRTAGRLVLEGRKVAGVELRRSSPAGGRGTERERALAPAVILAAGGASYPATGSTGDGYRMAEAAGHRIVPLRPALVPLETAGAPIPGLPGLTLRNVAVRVLVDGAPALEGFGELEFTRFGVSGPVPLSLSREIVDALRENRRVALSIDLKPALDPARLDARILRDLDAGGKKRVRNLLRDLLPKPLVAPCLASAGIPGDRVGHQLTSEERRRLGAWLKDVRLEITGHRPFEEAIVTAGGVDRSEIDPRTLASRLVEGLYFAGEVIDMDAGTGGFNLQAAFSTGWLAGRSAAGSPTDPKRRS